MIPCLSAASGRARQMIMLLNPGDTAPSRHTEQVALPRVSAALGGTFRRDAVGVTLSSPTAYRPERSLVSFRRWASHSRDTAASSESTISDNCLWGSSPAWR